MTSLAVAALSARALAEAAQRDGFGVVALDLFGDADTRAAAPHWTPIGRADLLQIDPDATLAALRELARLGRVDGWVAGSGFEDQPALLAAGAALLPLIGTRPDAVAAVRDPVRFFGVLDEQGIPHPPVSWQLPADGKGWLVKDARACGGAHVRRLSADDGEVLPLPALPLAALQPYHYVQREQGGVPMSATFLANGSEAQLWGCNEQMVLGSGERPFLFRGVIGPVPLPPGVVAEVVRAVSAVTRAFALKGVCGLDFLLDGDQVAVLEVNPRPPASMVLYADLAPMKAHWRACRLGVLPTIRLDTDNAPVQGSEIVFAHRPLVLGTDALSLLATWRGAHDVPCEAGMVPAGHPVCSLSAQGEDAAQVRSLLAARRDALTHSLETAA